MSPSSPSLLGRLALLTIFQPLQRWQQSRLPAEDTMVSTGGMRMKVFSPRHNRVGHALFVNGVWEPEFTGALRALIKPGDTVFDIGGDAGYYTLLFAKAVGPKGKVVVFEPIPKAQERILENVKLNGFTNVNMVDLALGSRPGSFVLERPFEDSRINLEKAVPSSEDILVKVERFDTLVAKRSLPRADLIKMDVEGAEMEILKGMESYVETHHPTFTIELHPQLLPQFGSSAEEVTSWLTQRGYTLTALDAGDISTSVATTFLARV